MSEITQDGQSVQAMDEKTINLLQALPNQSTRGSVLPLPPVWVVGAPRSGTTWFGRILDSNPHLFITEETRVMSFFNRVVNRVAQDRWLLQRGQAAMIKRLGADIPGLVERFYADLGAKPDQRWGDKHPHYADSNRDPEALTLIETLFPDSQYIHLIRDGRAVAASFRDMGWGTLEYSAKVWVNHVHHAREFGESLAPGRYLEVRYEELVSDPIKVSEGVFSFLGVPSEDYVERFMSTEGSAPWSKPTTPTEELGRASWADRFTPEDLEVVHDIQADSLIEFGYPVDRA